MTDDSESGTNPINSDDDKLWLKGGGAEVRFREVRPSERKRALDIVEGVRRRFRYGARAHSS